MQIEVTQTLLEKIPLLSLEKQQGLLIEVEAILEKQTPPTIWQKIRTRAKNVPAEVFDQMPRDGSENHDCYLNKTIKK